MQILDPASSRIDHEIKILIIGNFQVENLSTWLKKKKKTTGENLKGGLNNHLFPSTNSSSTSLQVLFAYIYYYLQRRMILQIGYN